MVRIKIDKDFWQNSVKKVVMYHEDCPNFVCTSRPLHYPEYLVKPYCPECNTDLFGIGFKDSSGRIAYHLGA